MYEINRKTLIESIDNCVRNNIVPHVTSSPGEGKSDIIMQFANTYNLKLIHISLTQYQPEDLLGFPFKGNNGKTQFMPIEELPLETDELPKNKDGWLIFLDELDGSDGATQVAAQKLILDRKVGNTNLHENAVIISAGNRPEDKAFANELSTALKSRLAHFTLKLETNEWIEWANANNIDSRIISFINYKPDCLKQFDPESTDKTFPCPRTWAMLSKLIIEIKDIENHLHLITAIIGESVSNDFYMFTKYFKNLPKISQIISNPKNTNVPSDIPIQYATIQHCVQYTTDSNFNPIFDYIEKFPLEIQVLFCKAVVAKHPTIYTKNQKLSNKMINILQNLN